MPLWGKNDQAGNAPKHQIISGNAANGYVMFANTTANSFIYNHTADGVNPAQSNVAVGVFGVDTTEQGVTDAGHAGWVKRVSYTDAHGNARVKHEVLVAMSSIANDATGATSAATASGTYDDSVFPDS